MRTILSTKTVLLHILEFIFYADSLTSLIFFISSSATLQTL
jgi:hypothetical protein